MSIQPTFSDTVLSYDKPSFWQKHEVVLTTILSFAVVISMAFLLRILIQPYVVTDQVRLNASSYVQTDVFLSLDTAQQLSTRDNLHALNKHNPFAVSPMFQSIHTRLSTKTSSLASSND